MKIYFILIALLSLIACNNMKKKEKENQAVKKKQISDKKSSEKDLPKVSSGTIKRLALFQSEFVTPRNVDVWLPDGYTENNKYPVLYMHDGQMLFDSSKTWNKQEWKVDEVISKLIEEKEIPGCIVVGVWNISEERHSDYFPQKPFESLPQKFRDSLINEVKRSKEAYLFTKEVCSDNYLKFIVEEVKPYIDEHFAVKTDRENTFIMGTSMGGLISMYAICEYPEIFGGAACLSTHWPGTFNNENNPIPAAFFEYLVNNLPKPENHKIYFDYGTETLDAMYEVHQLKVDSIMKEKGYTEALWKTMKFPGADHSENAWNKRLHIPLKFLFNNR